MRPFRSHEGLESGAHASPRRSTRRLRNSESGQATTEFALILLPLLIVVGGIIYFGIGLNYWLDMNRVANQGARWAAVNNWPAACPRNPVPSDTSYACSSTAANCNAALALNSKANLQQVLRCSTRNPSAAVSICYPGVAVLGTEDRGDPVKVKLTAPYKFWFVNSVGITLTATATARLEQKPTLITNEVASC
ncbi:MAG TPA: TadE/TadG family type IV pilus assembly protein [Gaiellaceae bacterium]|nr:TadE/TadG family type IV pilus assembly protein [Gaiellaceae bacterium]